MIEAISWLYLNVFVYSDLIETSLVSIHIAVKSSWSEAWHSSLEKNN